MTFSATLELKAWVKVVAGQVQTSTGHGTAWGLEEASMETDDQGRRTWVTLLSLHHT